MPDSPAAPIPPQILTRADGATIAYHATPGQEPGVVFLPGFMSDMTGGKALFLEEFCRRRNRSFIRFDYFGHGQSSGAFTEGTIGRWAEDAAAVLDEVARGPQVLVGSSMGGWIMLLAALARPGKVAGLLGLAPAPDFTEDVLPHELTAAQMATIEKDGMVAVPSPYGDTPTPITRALIEDGRAHLLLRKRLPIRVPVRVIHGQQDPDVPWQTSLKLSQMLESDNVEITFVKSAGHRLSEPKDLARLEHTLEALLDRVDKVA